MGPRPCLPGPPPTMRGNLSLPVSASLPPLASSNPGPTWHAGSCAFPWRSVRPLSLEVHATALTPGHETHSLLVLGQKWKQDVAELVLWIEEKGLRAADEPSREPSNILQQLKRHKAAERELLATYGHVEGLRQVGAPDRGAGPFPLQIPSPDGWPVSMEQIHRRKAHSQLLRN